MTDNKKAKPADFWNDVEVTNPDYTKTSNVSGMVRTAVDAQYKKKMITEKFGMYGLGWGVKADSEKFERITYPNQTIVLNYTAIAFYKWEGETAEIPIAAQCKECYITNGGKGYMKIDDEAYKKVKTSAITKAFTDLGFCADIHMGKFDDQDYVESAALKQRMKDDEEREEKAREVYEETKAWLETQIKSAETVDSDTQYDKIINRLQQKVVAKCNVAGIASRGFYDKLENLKKGQ